MCSVAIVRLWVCFFFCCVVCLFGFFFFCSFWSGGLPANLQPIFNVFASVLGYWWKFVTNKSNQRQNQRWMLASQQILTLASMLKPFCHQFYVSVESVMFPLFYMNEKLQPWFEYFLRNNKCSPSCTGQFDEKGRRHLLVPSIYFWCSAIPIDVLLSGSVCCRQATVLHFLFSQKEKAAQWCVSHYVASCWVWGGLDVKSFFPPLSYRSR